MLVLPRQSVGLNLQKQIEEESSMLLGGSKSSITYPYSTPRWMIISITTYPLLQTVLDLTMRLLTGLPEPLPLMALWCIALSASQAVQM